MACVGTADEPAASATSDRAAVPSGVSTGIHMEMRDGDKSKLRDEGILKAAVNIVDIIAHKLLTFLRGPFGNQGVDVVGRSS